MIVSNTGKIYTKQELLDYISSLGFNRDDVVDIISDKEELFSEINYLKDICDDWEHQADGYNSNIQTAVNELEVVIEKLRSGKGLTKNAAADRITTIIANYFGY